MRSATTPTLPLGLILGTAALASVLAAPPAVGQENMQTTILVSASVEAACSLQTEQISLNFGVYNDEVINKTATFSHNCPAGKSLTFSLVGGQGSDAAGNRGLPNIEAGGNPLMYRIFDPAGNPWVDDYNVVPNPGGLRTEQITGVMDAGNLSNVLPGQFSDTITLQLTVNP